MAAFLRSAPRPAPAECFLDCLAPHVCAALADEAVALSRLSGGGCTHWVDAAAPAAAGPPPCAAARCLLECLALAVFQFHRSRGGAAAFDGRAVGCEWWVQVRDPNEPLSMHWDCDEQRKGLTGVHVPPYLATVTYLTTASGAPTLVLPLSTDERGSATAAPPMTAFASFPVLGKHLAFDGRLLHGAPCDTEEDEAAHALEMDCAAARRVTILVNLWADHQPDGVHPLSDDLLAALPARDRRESLLEALMPSGSFGLHARPAEALWTESDAPWREFTIGSHLHPPVWVRALRPLRPRVCTGAPLESSEGAAPPADGAEPHFWRCVVEVAESRPLQRAGRCG